jgi:hypothetical protein
MVLFQTKAFSFLKDPSSVSLFIITSFEKFPLIFDCERYMFQNHYQYQLLMDICLFNILLWGSNSNSLREATTTTTGLYPQHNMP